MDPYNTPLHLAKTAAVAVALLDRGADVNAKNWVCHQPSHVLLSVLSPPP